jgi:HEAT repeat protein
MQNETTPTSVGHTEEYTLPFAEWRELIQSPDVHNRSHAANMLPEGGDDEEVVALLTAALGDADEFVRTCAADSLGNCHLDSAREALRKAAATEKSELALSYILVSLAMIGELHDIQLMLPYLHDSSTSHRLKVNAAEAVQRIVLDKVGYPMLREAFGVYDPKYGWSAEPLIRTVDSYREFVAAVKSEALAKLEHAKYPKDLDEIERLIGEPLPKDNQQP